MVSLDVDSLFTNVPLNETIDICIDSLYSSFWYRVTNHAFFYAIMEDN